MKRCAENFPRVCPDYPDKCSMCGAFREPTNADRLRSMDDEELAKAIAGADWCEYCDQVQENGTCHAMELGGPLNQYCIAGCLKWLQHPAEEDDHA